MSTFFFPAINDGCDVQGVFLWSLLDTFEWMSGFDIKFGLYWVDMGDDNRPRYPRASANFYSMMITDNGFSPAVRDFHACKTGY